MKEYQLGDPMPDQYQKTLFYIMQTHAMRELVAGKMFGYGLQFCPSYKWLKFISWHIQEEVNHFGLVDKMYKDVTGESIEPAVNKILERSPIEFAESWLELAMAQFLFDRGGYWQLLEFEDCSFVPYRNVIKKIIEEEKGHQDLGAKLVVELCEDGKNSANKQQNFNKWLREGMLCFGRPNSPGADYAIEVGLKKRTPSQVFHRYVEDLKPTMREAGLVFPEMKDIGIEAPDDLNFSLD